MYQTFRPNFFFQFFAGEFVFVSEDEEIKKFNKEKLKTLRPVFKKEGGMNIDHHKIYCALPS